MGKKVRRVEGARLSFHCPGCGDSHVIPTKPPNGWTFNGDLERPTLQPSLLLRSGHFASGWKKGEDCWCTYNSESEKKGEMPAPFKCMVCHSHVKDGQLQFLSDCTHALAGKTVPMEDVE